MKNSIIQKIISNQFYNNTIQYMNYYFSKEDNCFYALTEEEASIRMDVERDLIEAPCVYRYQNIIWKMFREMLSEEQCIVADSYPFKHGYFKYLQEEGLIEIYYEAKNSVLIDVCTDWIEINNLELSLDDIVLA